MQKYNSSCNWQLLSPKCIIKLDQLVISFAFPSWLLSLFSSYYARDLSFHRRVSIQSSIKKVQLYFWLSSCMKPPQLSGQSTGLVNQGSPVQSWLGALFYFFIFLRRFYSSIINQNMNLHLFTTLVQSSEHTILSSLLTALFYYLFFNFLFFLSIFSLKNNCLIQFRTKRGCAFNTIYI